jgi:transglutaminase-like putative cysteine protease
MHAWAEAFVPEAGWTGFDPTNDLLAGDNHIKVAHGKDYQDCAPLKGVIFAPGENQTKHSVEVSARQSQQ